MSLNLALLFLLIALAAGGSEACPSTLKRAFRSPKVTSLKEAACFTVESMRIDTGTSGTSYAGLGSSITVDSCKKYCSENGFTGKIVALDTECHCNKIFKDYGQRDMDKCEYQCPGNAVERCGGAGYVSAYPA